MAFNKIRGQQIQDNQISDNHIKTKLSESVLDIDFISHAGEILSQKLVVDYVQKQNLTVLDTGGGTTFAFATQPSTGPGEVGVILKTQNDYRVLVRDSATGEPLTDIDDREIYGYLTTYNTADQKYTLELFVEDVSTGNDVAYNAVGDLNIDIVFPQRFTLQSVSEMFAANTKFVDGSADVTTHLNIDQIVTDIFGNGYNLKADGEFSDFLGTGNTLLEHIVSKTTGLNSGEEANTIIDEVVAGRGTEANINSRFVNIENHIFTGGPIDTRLEGLETSISNALTSESTGTNYGSLDARLNGIEDNIVNAASAIFADLADEEDVAKGASLVHVNKNSDIATHFALTTNNMTVGVALDELLGEIDTRVNAEEQARIDAINSHKTELAGVTSGLGSNLIGVEDAGSNFLAETVEGVLLELFTKINEDVAAEVTARQNADAALQSGITANKDTLDTAAGTKATLDERLDVAFKDNGELRGFDKFHKHYKKIKTATADTATMVFTFSGVDQFNTPKDPIATDDHYDIHINGIEQYEGVHYDVTIVGNDLTVTFNDTSIFIDDVVQLKATIYADSQPV